MSEEYVDEDFCKIFLQSASPVTNKSYYSVSVSTRAFVICCDFLFYLFIDLSFILHV